MKCKVLVVPGYGAALLGMPDIKLLNVLNILCNTVNVLQRCKGIMHKQQKRNATQTKI